MNYILLTQVNALIEKYNEIAKITGENFNIFSIQKMDNNEVYMHSAFLGELLNPNGTHGLKDIPLKLFLEEIKESFTKESISYWPINAFDLNTSQLKTEVEKNIGLINDEYTKGGRIDIIIEDNSENKKQVLIENKINAKEQKNQLLRYKNAYPNALILYLTLFGENSENLTRNEDYFCISYERHILNWLKKCHTESTDYPMLREVIKQYIYLIKKLTNQTTNRKMKEEILRNMAKNVRASFEIANNIYSLKDTLFLEFMSAIEEECKTKSFNFTKEWNDETNLDYGFYVTKNGINRIHFLFQFGNFKGFYYGLEIDNGDQTIIKEGYINNGKLLWKYWENNSECFGDNIEIWEDIAKKEKGDTFKKVFEIVEELTNINSNTSN